MKKPADQFAFYVLLVELLWYLASGKSHVGYSCNCLKNNSKLNWYQLHFLLLIIARVIDECIIVQPLSEVAFDSEEFVESDVDVNDSDDDELGEREWRDWSQLDSLVMSPFTHPTCVLR
jgi:8-oxo-dGTP pyrophosphatase MutT (NUDIX family)